jgi:cytochrome c553
MKKLLFISVLIAALQSIAMSADVKANWEKHCQKCHGPDGKGETKMGRQSGVKDYTDAKVQAELTDEKAIKIIKEGLVEKGKKKMDAYGDKLTDDEIKSLLAHIRTFKK